MPIISVIMPIYNGSSYISKSIEIILKQTFRDFELILIDDGSTDNSKEICEKYAKNDERIKLIYKENSGAWAARNEGIKSSIGKYIMFLDCDDWYEDNLLQEMYEHIKKNDLDLVICGQTNVIVDSNNDNIKYENVLSRELQYNNNDEVLSNYIYLREKDIGDVLWNKIYKAEIIKKNNLRFQNIRLGEDTIFNANYYEKTNKCMVLNESLYYYRIDKSKPVWLKYCENYCELLIEEHDCIVNKLIKWNKYDEAAKQYQSSHLIRGIIGHFYWIFYPRNNFTFIQKYKKIDEILNNDKIKNCLVAAKGYTKYENIVIKYMKIKSSLLLLILLKFKIFLKNPY